MFVEAKVINSYLINNFIIIALSDNIFKAFINNDNKNISTLLKKMIYIYGKNLKRKKLYYFMKFYRILEILKSKEIKSNIFSSNRRSYGNLYNNYTIKNSKKENIRMNQLFNESALYPFSPLINESGYITFRPNNHRNSTPYTTRHSFYNKNNPTNQKFSSHINPFLMEKNFITENSKLNSPYHTYNGFGNYMNYNKNEDYPGNNYSLTNRDNRFGNSKRNIYGFYRPISKTHNKYKNKNKYLTQNEDINTKITEYLNNFENNKKKINLLDPNKSNTFMNNSDFYSKRRYKSNNNINNRSNYDIIDQGKGIFTNNNDNSNIINNKKIGEIENYFNKKNNNKYKNNFKLNKERLSFKKNHNNSNNNKVNNSAIKYSKNKYNQNNNEDKNNNKIYNDSKDYFYSFNKENNNNYLNNNKGASKKNSNASLNPSSLGFDHMKTFYTNNKKNSNNNVNIANSNINSASSRMMDTHYHFLNGLKMMSGEVNEYFYDFNSSKKGKNDDERSVQSLQSLSDSKMLQLAQHYLSEEDEDSVENYQMNNILFNRKKHNIK